MLFISVSILILLNIECLILQYFFKIFKINLVVSVYLILVDLVYIGLLFQKDLIKRMVKIVEINFSNTYQVELHLKYPFSNETELIARFVYENHTAKKFLEDIHLRLSFYYILWKHKWLLILFFPELIILPAFYSKFLDNYLIALLFILSLLLTFSKILFMKKNTEEIYSFLDLAQKSSSYLYEDQAFKNFLKVLSEGSINNFFLKIKEFIKL